MLRRRAEIPADIVAGPTVLTGDQLAERYGADPADVDLVRRTLAGLGLEITAVHPASRRIKVAGTLGQLSGVFGAELRQVSSPAPRGQGTVTHRYREGALFVPAPLDGVVLAVLGLETIAVIELGGGFSGSRDLDTYFAGLGIDVPTVTAASVDGGSNAPGSDPNGADVEVALDVDVIGAAAPGAAQVVYFAPNSDSGFIDAISEAVQATPAPIAISISWGQSEDSWTAQGRSAMDAAMADAAALGITVCVASGDNGSGDAVDDGQPHVDFPASSPHALACGGTKLLADAATGAISSEVIWNETAANEGAGGGGVSDEFALPSWQADAGVPARAGSGSGAAGGRGVPDVAGNADPATGYQIYSGGKAQVVGGTSAVAPLWAALISRLAEASGQRFGLIQTLLYAGVAPGTAVPGFRDITSGNNGAYAAGPAGTPARAWAAPTAPRC